MKILTLFKTGAGQAILLGLLSFFLIRMTSLWLHLPWLVFFIFIPFLIGLLRVGNIKQSILAGFCFGCLFYGLALFWITHVSFVLFGLAVMIQAVFCALFGAGFYILRRKRPVAVFCLYVAGLWMVTEFARCAFFFGLPVGLLGYLPLPDLPFVQIASWVGVYGLSFLVMLINSLLTGLIHPAHSVREKTLLVLLATILVLLPHLAGRKMLSQAYPPDSFQVTVIQPNIPSAQKRQPGYWPQNLNIYRTMSAASVSSQPGDLVIWPETAVPFFLFHSQRAEILQQIRDTAQDLNQNLLIGAQDFKMEENDRLAFNVAVLFSAQGELLEKYAKIKLVPVLEYMPIRRLIPWVRRLGGVGVYRPGRQTTVFRLPHASFSVVICFEGLFPNLVRRFVNRGADFLINMTNDEPSLGDMKFYYEQNARMLRIRAIENRRSIVRVANNGISMVIDPWGRVVRQAPAFSRATFRVGVPLMRQKTLYGLLGNWIVWLGLVGLAAVWRFSSAADRF